MPTFTNQRAAEEFENATKDALVTILQTAPPAKPGKPAVDLRFSDNVCGPNNRPWQFTVVGQHPGSPEERKKAGLPKRFEIGGITQDDYAHILTTARTPDEAAARIIGVIFHDVPANQSPDALEIRKTVEAAAFAAISKRLEELGFVPGSALPSSVGDVIRDATALATKAGEQKAKEQHDRDAAVPQGVQGKAKGIKKMDAIEKETAKQETRLQYRQLVDANWKSAKNVPMSKTPEPAEASKSGWWFALVKREWTRFQQHQLNEATRTAEIEAEQKEAAEEAVAKAHFQGAEK